MVASGNNMAILRDVSGYPWLTLCCQDEDGSSSPGTYGIAFTRDSDSDVVRRSFSVEAWQLGHNDVHVFAELFVDAAERLDHLTPPEPRGCASALCIEDTCWFIMAALKPRNDEVICHVLVSLSDEFRQYDQLDFLITRSMASQFGTDLQQVAKRSAKGSL